MRREYDFTHGKRGKFFRKDSATQLPVYVDAEIFAFLKERARVKGIDVNELVNSMLRQGIARIESAK